jgi:hypothetical protein
LGLDGRPLVAQLAQLFAVRDIESADSSIRFRGAGSCDPVSDERGWKMPILELAFAVITSIRPPADDADEARLRNIAATVVGVASESPFWPGDEGRAATTTMLLAIAFNESGFQERVQRCKIRGDRGRSIGLFQLMRGMAWNGHTEQEICTSDTLQAELALRVLRIHAEQCRRPCPPQAWLRGYAAGDRTIGSIQSKRLAATWTRFSQRVGLVVTPDTNRAPRWQSAQAAARWMAQERTHDSSGGHRTDRSAP